MVVKHDIAQNTHTWLLMRLNLVTASRAYLLLKKGVRAAQNASDKESGGGYWSKRGHDLESEAIEVYEAVTGKKTEVVGFVTNSKYPNAGCSPDRWGIEIKCFAEEKHLKCLKEIPIEVYCQAQFSMMICEKKTWDVVFYNPDIEESRLCFKIVKVKRDEALLKRFEEKLNG